MEPSNMVTIHDISRETGVSPNTVARILSGRRGRPYNEDKVLRAAKKYGYVRNEQAANLRTGRSKFLGLTVPDIQNPHYPLFYQAAHDVAAAQGYHILLSSTFGRVTEELQALQLFEVNRVAGIIINSAEGETDEACDARLEAFTKRGVPVVVCGRSSRGLQFDESMVKNAEAAARAVNYLHRTGHKRVGFIGGPLETLAATQRLAGFRDGLKACGLSESPELILAGEFTMASGAQQIRRLLDLPKRPTAILAANDLLAIGAIQTAQGAGIEVPRDLAVIGFGDTPYAELFSPKLTTLRVPTKQIAQDCVNIVLERIQAGLKGSPRQLIYEAELIVRESA